MKESKDEVQIFGEDLYIAIISDQIESLVNFLEQFFLYQFDCFIVGNENILFNE